ncbi:hypothetical protein HanIR_Chr02g0073371 [Helianthus annuus]|nr:hypothetical protein HanIR_Chr02g0073371 [Helianthus annuus]
MIIDALSAKMSLFHLGTPAEHFYYWRVSGPELGNALMLNQAQSNSLVVGHTSVGSKLSLTAVGMSVRLPI